MRVLLVGGGTGGHVYPILAVVDALRRLPNADGAVPATQLPGAQDSAHGALAAPPQGCDWTPTAMTAHVIGDRPPAASANREGEPDGLVPKDVTRPGQGANLRFVGEAGGIEERLAEQSLIGFSAVESGQVLGKAPREVARSLARMRRGAAQCAAVVRDFRPDVALLTGGYVTVPAAWAAWRARPRVPVLIYLPDLSPGLAVRLTSRLAERVAVSFPEAARYFPGKAVVTGYPVRATLQQADKDASRAALGLEASVPVLLAFGGSRGAQSINRALLGALPMLLNQCQVVHITGTLDWPWLQEAARTENGILAGLAAQARERYHVYPYLHDEMAHALGAADLVIARAGASVLGEFPALGLPSILVPYPYAGQHQEANAAYLTDRGAAVTVQDDQLSERMAPLVLELLAQPERLSRMARSARALARPDASARIVAELSRLAAVKDRGLP